MISKKTEQQRLRAAARDHSLQKTKIQLELPMSLICQMTSEDIKHQLIIELPHIVQELCESRGGRPGLSVLTSLQVSVDVKSY